MKKEDVEQRIIDYIKGAQVQVADTTGTGDHFSAVVISDTFSGKSLLQRHKLVYASLLDVLTRELHALQLKTYTIKEWNNIKK